MISYFILSNNFWSWFDRSEISSWYRPVYEALPGGKKLWDLDWRFNYWRFAIWNPGRFGSLITSLSGLVVGRFLIGSPVASNMPYPRRSRGLWSRGYLPNGVEVSVRSRSVRIWRRGGPDLIFRRIFLLWKPVPDRLYGRHSSGRSVATAIFLISSCFCPTGRRGSLRLLWILRIFRYWERWSPVSRSQHLCAAFRFAACDRSAVVWSFAWERCSRALGMWADLRLFNDVVCPFRLEVLRLASRYGEALARRPSIALAERIVRVWGSGRRSRFVLWLSGASGTCF